MTRLDMDDARMTRLIYNMSSEDTLSLGVRTRLKLKSMRKFSLDRRQKNGNSYSIMSTYKKEIKAWLQLKNSDGDGFHKFYNFSVKVSQNQENGIHWTLLI